MATVALQAGYQLVLTTDEFSSGYYYIKGNPGEQPGNPTAIDVSSEVIIGPFNVNRMYALVDVKGNIAHVISLDIIEDAVNTLEDLTDTNIVTPLDGDILVFDGDVDKWLNQTNTSGPTAIDDLTDVNIVAPSNSQILTYNGGVWSNEDAPQGFSGDYNDLTNKPSIPTSTTDLAEGTNLYYTAARFNTAFGAKSTLDLTENTNLYYTQARFDTAFSAKSTTNLTEGTNLYYTDARFNTAFATKTTADLTENTNLYYTDERVDDRVSNLMISGTFTSWSYVDGSNTLKVDLSATGTPSSSTFLRGDNVWDTPAGGSIGIGGYISGNWYAATGIGHTLGLNGTATALTTGTIYFYPFYCSETTTFTKIGMRVVTGSAATNVNMGIYANSLGKPTGNPLANTTSGSVSTASSGATVSYTFGGTVTLTGGTWYWLAATNSSSTPTFDTCAPGQSGGTSANTGLGEASFTLGSNKIIGYTQAFVYNTTLPTVGSLTGRTEASTLHVIKLQV
jgi:hypothetical protein